MCFCVFLYVFVCFCVFEKGGTNKKNDPKGIFLNWSFAFSIFWNLFFSEKKERGKGKGKRKGREGRKEETFPAGVGSSLTGF